MPIHQGLQEVAVTPRPLSAYRDMFALTDVEMLAGPVLDCPSGGSPFGAQMRAMGGEVVSVDPAYAAPAGLSERVLADVEKVVAWQRSAPDRFDWSYLGSPDAMGALWRDAAEAFAADFAPDGIRYVAAQLPDLPFPDDRFALSLSGFLLFVYPDLFDHAAVRAALRELVRVTSGEVRVFPLHGQSGEASPLLAPVMADLARSGVACEIRTARCSYSPLPGGDRMLVCRKEPS